MARSAARSIALSRSSHDARRRHRRRDRTGCGRALGPPNARLSNPRELRWGTHGSKSVRLDRGVWHDHELGQGGGVLDLLRRELGLESREGVAWLRDHGHRLDDRLVHQRQSRRPVPARDADLHFVEQLWRESEPIGADGMAYLAGRGISLDDVPERGGLRFHRRCAWQGGARPCILARFTDAITGEPRGIYRRPIDGSKPRTLGPAAGCIIRLWPDDAVTEGLVLGEGVETVLAAATRIEHRGTLLQPAWATGGTANMAGFPVLAGIESLTLLVDHDASGGGERAADQCAERWREAGREVIRLVPSEIGDFNDLVRA